MRITYSVFIRRSALLGLSFFAGLHIFMGITLIMQPTADKHATPATSLPFHDEFASLELTRNETVQP